MFNKSNYHSNPSGINPRNSSFLLVLLTTMTIYSAIHLSLKFLGVDDRMILKNILEM
jgi:hypothetical protein